MLLNRPRCAVQWHGSGFSGTGFKFDKEEESAAKKVRFRVWIFGGFNPKLQHCAAP